MATAPPQLSRFLDELSGRRERLLGLVHSEDEERAALVAELNELSEQLIVADEELRTQQEELEEAREQLVGLATERELLFSAVPHALVVTDAHGTVRRTTQAADRLARRPSNRTRPHPIAVWFDVADRRLIRSMISRRHSGHPRPERARLRRVDGTSGLVLVTVSPTEDPDGEELLHWQLVDLADEAPGTDGPAGSPRLEVAAAVADLCVRLEQAHDAEDLVAQVVAATSRLVPEAEHVELVLGVAGAESQAEPLRVAAGTVLVVPLPALARIRGELVLYARDADPFPAAAEATALLVAAHAGVALARRYDEENLQRAVESRGLIGQAVGILAERHRVTADDAFARLRQTSQRSHVKLREVAGEVCGSVLDPDRPPAP